MRHYKKGRKLGTDPSHTKAMKKNLAVNLFTHDRIKTIESRAKEVRGDIDRIVTWAKRGDLHSRRLAIAKLGDKELVREIFEKAAQGMWADRNGGYTRILKLGPRKGDNAPMVILELVTEPVKKKEKRTEAADEPKAAAGAAAAPADDETAEAAAEEAAGDEAVADDEAAAGDEAAADGETEEAASDETAEAAEAADDAAVETAEAAEEKAE